MSERDSDHELADSLLPWFVNGTLGRDEHGMVERHAAGCDECRGNVELLARVRNVAASGTPTPMVPPPRPDALLKAVDARQSRRRLRHLTWLVAAPLAAALLAAAILLPARYRGPEEPLQFETAISGARPLPMDYVLSVRFDDGAPPPEHERVLAGIGARQISATDDPSVYRVVIALPVTSLEDLERYTKQMESMPGVQRVKAVALQLPVSPPQ